MSHSLLPYFSSLLHRFPLPYAIGCLIFLSASLLVMDFFVPHLFFYNYLFIFILFLSSSFFLSSRMSSSLSPYIISRLRSFLPPWTHPWKVSLMGLMWCLRLQLLPLLLLHREFLLRLLSLPLCQYP